MLRDLRNGFRLLRLGWHLARHDALFVLDGLAPLRTPAALVRMAMRRLPTRRPTHGGPELRPGQRLARALHDAGPSFVKFGQALSTRSDLLGEELATDLSELQDQLPPFPFAQVRATIESEFGRPLEQLYRSFGTEPIAAASISQVHFAETVDGEAVAVKVLRPGIERLFARDMDLYFWIAERAEAALPRIRRLRLVDSVQIIADSVATEMDLRFEAAAAAELAENFRDDRDFHVPIVDWTRTSQRVLTLERVIGMPIDERACILAAGHDPHLLLQRAATAFFRQVFRDGFFHADLHAGNMFARADGSIAVVDFGIMGRLDRRTRRHLGELLLAFLSRDFRRAAEVHFEAGWIPADRSVEAFAQACRSIAEPILDRPQNEISVASLLGQLFQVTETFAMPTQPQLLLLQKTMLVAEGVGRSLAPDANMWVLARPMIAEWTARTMAPDSVLREAGIEAADALRRLPDALRRIDRGVSTLAQGKVTLDPASLRAVQAGGGALGWYVALVLAVLLAFA